jgi:hypothetical protein
MKAQTVIDPNGLQSVEVEKHYKKWLQVGELFVQEAREKVSKILLDV